MLLREILRSVWGIREDDFCAHNALPHKGLVIAAKKIAEVELRLDWSKDIIESEARVARTLDAQNRMRLHRSMPR